MTVWSGIDKLLNLIADPMLKTKGAGPKQTSPGITKHFREYCWSIIRKKNSINPGEKTTFKVYQNPRKYKMVS